MTKEPLDENSLAMLVSREIKFATLYGDRQILYYKDGVYLPNGADIIAADIERRMNGDKVTNHMIKEVTGHIQRRTFVDRDDFDASPNIINMANGLYNIETGLHPHTSKYLSLHKNPVTYDPDATYDHIDKFIREVVPEDKVQTIYEIVGYALAPRKNLKRAFIFEGGKNSGKSVMIELIEKMIGSHATTHVSPLDVSRTTYGAAEYYGKQLNLVDDLGNTPIEDTGLLKSVIGGGRINAQFKYMQPFDYQPNILCIFATNEVPPTASMDDAYASRFSIIKFPNTFEGDSDNPNLIDELATEENLSGFFNRCIDAYRGLVENETFTGDGTLADRIKAYRYNSDPVSRFVDEKCVVGDWEDYISRDVAYRAYVTWSNEQKITVAPMGKLTSCLKELGCAVRRPHNDNGDRYYAYYGMTLKPWF